MAMDEQQYEQWLQYQQSMNGNTAGQKNETAAKDISSVTSGLSGALSAIPIIGQIAGPAIAGAGAIASGIEEAVAAKKQKQQAASDQQAAANMPAPALPAGFRQKLVADQAASTQDKPGLEENKNALLQNFVGHMRAIRESSPTGSHTVNAIAESLGLENESLNKLMVDNADYQAEHAQKFRDDLWNLGLQNKEAQQTQFEDYTKPLLEQGTALQNAATANKQTAANTIAGSISNTATNVLNGVQNVNQKQQQQDYYTKMMNLFNSGKTTTTNNTDNSYAPTTGGQSNSPDNTAAPLIDTTQSYFNYSPYFSSAPATPSN